MGVTRAEEQRGGGLHRVNRVKGPVNRGGGVAVGGQGGGGGGE